MRPTCCVYIATTLDGFIARLDGGIDWLEIVHSNEDYGYAAFMAGIDTLVVGRKTYETALGFEGWPYTGKRCVVMTSTKPTAVHDETFFDGDPASLTLELAKTGAKRVYVDGGAVIQQFLAKGLIAELTLSIVPVLIGTGIRLFGETGRDVRLELIASRSFASGLAQLHYRAAV